MRCVLIGNGTSILDAPWRGEHIDAFDIVARLNAFQIKAYEQFTGTRCDVLFTVMPAQGWRAAIDWRAIFTHSWTRDPLNCAITKSWTQWHQNHPASIEPSRIEHSMLRQMSEYAETDYATWSTGAIAAWKLLQEQPQITMTGFDWWDRSSHHYCDNAVRGTLHKPQIEKSFFDKLAAEGRVSWLP